MESGRSVRREGNGQRNGTIIVSSCDQSYFPLVKGLFLSLLRAERLPAGLSFGFLDAGCEEASLAWMERNGILVRRFDQQLIGEVASASFGFRRAQICRPFLPRLFPEARTLVWMDADIWVQDVAGVLKILSDADDHRNQVYASPEFHYTYTRVTNFGLRAKETYELYHLLYGPATAEYMVLGPTYNSGFFAAASEHPLWREWQTEVERIYLGNDQPLPPLVRHLAEQASFNYLLHRRGCAAQIDPIYNYLCLWTPPFRDPAGIVRVSEAPNVPLGVIHLAGGWHFFGEIYMKSGLLYNRGMDLSSAEKGSLIAATGKPDVRYS